MTSHLEVTWESYSNNICQGFSRLQYNEEFVDMTLAADGYMVKVHKNILALSSPYMKAMLKSVDCSHPIIFLNNVSYEVLTYILEYIYTGKAHVPTESLDSFMKTCKALKVEGLQDISSCIGGFTCPQTTAVNSTVNRTEHENTEPTQSNNDFAALITINEEKSFEIRKCDIDNRKNIDNETNDNYIEVMDSDQIVSEQLVNDNVYFDTSLSQFEVEQTEIPTKIDTTSNDVGFKLRDIELKPVYTISNRGALQLLLNRFMYLCHHQSHRGFKRRWRCVDYRRARCPAVIDTEGEIITARKGLHNHPFHDEKILKKCRNSIVFKTLSQAVTGNDNRSGTIAEKPVEQ